MTRLYLELAGLVALIAAFVLYSNHERGIGEATCQADIKASYAQASSSAQSKHEAELVTVTHIGDLFNANTSLPLATPAPVFRLCDNPVHSSTEARASTTPIEHHESSSVRAEDPVQPAEWDSSGVVRAGRDADEQIKGLQAYIKDVCLK